MPPVRSRPPPPPSPPRPPSFKCSAIQLLPNAAGRGARDPFAGRLGGNQTYVVDRSNPENADLLKKVPDAAPNLNFREAFDFRGFTDWDLYKAAVIEGVGT